MISILIRRSSEGDVLGFRIKGHADYRSSRDIVCAAVSAIAYTAAGALEEMAGIRGHKEEDGYMEFGIDEDISGTAREKAKIILEAASIGFMQIRNSYGKYVVIADREV